MWRLTSLSFSAFFLFGLVMACTGDGGTGTGLDDDDDGPAPDTQPPQVTSTSPSDDATGVDTLGAVEVWFSEPVDPGSVSSSTFYVGGVSASVAIDGDHATLTPDGPLAPETAYDVTVTTGVRDTAGNALESDYTWSFETVTRPAPAFTFPLEVGNVWRYERIDSTIVCGGSTGCSKSRFIGYQYLRVEQYGTLDGREAWRVALYSINEASGSDPGLSATNRYLSVDGSGLLRYRSTSSGGSWRRVVSTSSSSIPNGAFLLVGGPSYGDASTVSPSSVAVPAGSYSTLRVEHEYRETGQYATEDIFETRVEHYADGVGLVAGYFDFTEDPNDPAATDIFSEGVVRLTHMNGGPLPYFVAETEPNDSADTATGVETFTIAAGSIDINDPGAIMTDAAVGCAEECIYPDENGDKKLGDWYRLDVASTTELTIELVFDTYADAYGIFNDLDLYLFQATDSGLVYAAASTSEPGEPEILSGTAGPATYYLAVQGWRTGGDVTYHLGLR